MPKLVIPRDIYNQIVSIVVQAPKGSETGVSLFGTSVESDSSYVVLAVAGPGMKATHEAAHYSGDEDHANAIYEALQSAMPGIRWMGELHLHPRGMTWLSRGDRRTVRQILTGTDPTNHPEEFVAGVMQRHAGAVDIYPVHFSRTCLEGERMKTCVVDASTVVVEAARLKGVKDDRPSICTQSEGSRTPIVQACRHRWLRQWWKRISRYGRALRNRQIHAH